MTFSGSQKPTPPTVFNLLALDSVHCEEETGDNAVISRLSYKFVKKKMKVVYFATQKCAHFKKFGTMFIFYLFNIFGHTYIFIKCIDILKFNISIKSYEE